MSYSRGRWLERDEVLWRERGRRWLLGERRRRGSALILVLAVGRGSSEGGQQECSEVSCDLFVP